MQSSKLKMQTTLALTAMMSMSLDGGKLGKLLEGVESPNGDLEHNGGRSSDPPTGKERCFELSEKAKARKAREKKSKANYVHPMVRKKTQDLRRSNGRQCKGRS